MGRRILWFLLLGFASLQAEQQPRFKTDVNYIRVDVFPTKDGQPVPDLTAADFEVSEDGVPQRIDSIERIVIRSGERQQERRDPNTVAESREAVNGARDRVFVLFLDFNHVDIDGSRRVRQPLVRALDRLLGPDDLVAVMTPEMRARDIVFARKTTTIDGILERYWTWGERNRLNPVDPIDDYYKLCYPGAGPLQIPGPTPPAGEPRPLPSQTACQADDRGVADEMIERRREKETLDALHDLVGFLATAGDSRKAILALTEGWRLFEPSQSLGRELYCQAPRPSDLGVDPKTGRITTTSRCSTRPWRDSSRAGRRTRTGPLQPAMRPGWGPGWIRCTPWPTRRTAWRLSTRWTSTRVSSAWSTISRPTICSAIIRPAGWTARSMRFRFA